MLVIANNFKTIKKIEPIIKKNDTLFYLGKDGDKRKYFLEKPGLHAAGIIR